MRTLLITLSLLGLTLALSAQSTTTQRGQVIDAKTKQGIPFVLVNANQAFFYTDEAGFFTIPETLLIDDLQIGFSQIGYESQQFNIAEKGQRTVQFELVAKKILLEEVLVQGEAKFVHPQSNIIVDQAKQSSQARDVADLFADQPGFGVIKKGAFAMDPVFRGFKYEQLNLIYDGGVQTVHACPGRMDPGTTHINPQDVQKIEIIRGPFSVRYGPALGVTINIVTDPAAYQKKNGFGGSFSGGYETNGAAKVGKINLYGAKKNLDLSISGGWKDYGNYESGSGTIIPSAFSNYDYGAKLGLNLTTDQRLQFNWRQSFGRDILHAGLPMDTELDNSTFYALDYKWKNISPRLSAFQFKAYGTKVEHIMTNHLRPNFMMVDGVAEVEAATYGGKAEVTWMPDNKSVVYVGTDFRYIGRDGERIRLMKRNMMTGEELTTPIRMVDAIWQQSSIYDAGLFVDLRHAYSPQWTFTLGTRLDHVWSVSKAPASDFLALYENLDTQRAWNLGVNTTINYTSKNDWQWQLALGRGVRTPNMIERYINHFTVGLDAYEYVGNPNLQAEVNRQVELSLQKQAGQFGLTANVFYARIKNFITAAVDTTLSRKFMGSLVHARRFNNIDLAEKYGFEISGTWAITKAWEASLGMAYTRAQNLDWEEPLPEIPPLVATAGIRYEHESWWTDLRARFVDQQDRVSTRFGEGATAGFSVFDFRAGATITEALSFGLSIQNLFDRNYREHLNRFYRNGDINGAIYDPCRNFTFFLKYDF